VIRNRLKAAYEQKKPSFGTYVTLPAVAIAEIVASAGLDFVRVDTYKNHFDPEKVDNMVRAIYGYDATPWVRCPLDAREIGIALDVGAQVISAKVNSAEEARAVVAAVRYPPRGTKESSRPRRFRTMPDAEYQKWAAEEVLVSLQLESIGAWEHYKEIVRVDGVNIIQFGKHGISQALGVPIELSGYGREVAPELHQAEKAVVTAALEAGKQVCLMDSATPYGLERLMRWIEQGVLVIGLDNDAAVLSRGYEEALRTLYADTRVGRRN
jgi:4-hydroxy-2-oxoheptanedioate aldolase